MSRYFFLYPRFVFLLRLALSLFGLSVGTATFTVTNFDESGPSSL